MKADLVRLATTEEEFKKMNEENKFYDEHSQHFHRKIFEKMQDDSMFLAYHILDKQGKKTGVGDFVEQFSKLIKEIMKEKIELLGSYLKK